MKQALERAVKNILQGDVQIVKEAALEMCCNRGPLLLGHRFKLPVRAQDVHIVKNKGGAVQAVNLNRITYGVYDPVFPDPLSFSAVLGERTSTTRSGAP